MVTQVGLEALLRPKVDRKQVDKELSDIERKTDPLSLDADIDAGGLGGDVGGGVAGDLGGGGDGLAAGAVGGGVGSGGLGGLASSGVVKASLVGAVGFGILKGVTSIAEASPAFQKTQEMFGSAMELFFRPFGKELSKSIFPFAKNALKMAKNFNKIYSEKGLDVAIASMEDSVQESLANSIEVAIKGANELEEQIREDPVGFLKDIFGQIDSKDLIKAVIPVELGTADFWLGVLGKVDWLEVLDPPEWPSIFNPLEWGHFVNPLTWGTFIVGELAWEAYIDPVNWSDWLGGLEDWVEGLPFVGDEDEKEKKQKKQQKDQETGEETEPTDQTESTESGGTGSTGPVEPPPTTREEIEEEMEESLTPGHENVFATPKELLNDMKQSNNGGTEGGGGTPGLTETGGVFERANEALQSPREMLDEMEKQTQKLDDVQRELARSGSGGETMQGPFAGGGDNRSLAEIINEANQTHNHESEVFQ